MTATQTSLDIYPFIKGTTSYTDIQSNKKTRKWTSQDSKFITVYYQSSRSLVGFITYLRLSGQSPAGLKCVAGAEVFCWVSELFTAAEARSSSVFVVTENGVSRLVSIDFIICAVSIASSWGGSSLGGAGGAGSWGSGGSGGKGGGATSGGRGGGCENNWVFPTMELLKLLLNWLFLFFLRFFLFPPPLPNGLKPRPVFLLARLNFTGL